MKLSHLFSSLVLSGLFLFLPQLSYADSSIENADDISYVDEIKINGRAFESLNNRVIEFYQEDLKDGQIVATGLLESDAKDVRVEALSVEITTDGGETWTRAKGHAQWEWSFTPQTGRAYEFSLRVVKIVPSETLPSNLNIAGFLLTLNDDATLTEGVLSGSGRITIPYLTNLALPGNHLNVNFEALHVVNNTITHGDIIHNQPLTLETPFADIAISKVVFSATPAHNRLEGRVTFKGALASITPVALPAASRLLPTSFMFNIPINGKRIDIWDEQGVSLALSEGNIRLSYAMTQSRPTLAFSGLSGSLQMGTLLTNGANVRNSVALPVEPLSGAVDNYTALLTDSVYLLGTGMALPQGMEISLNLSNISDPQLFFSSSIDLSGYENALTSHLQEARIDARVSQAGLVATVSSQSTLGPVTLLERGGDGHDVRLLFSDTGSAFSITASNESPLPHLSINTVSAELDFGDLLQRSKAETFSAANSIRSHLSGSPETGMALTLDTEAYLLGSGIKLPAGMSMSLDLSDLDNPLLTLSGAVDFSAYDNFLARRISGAHIDATLSRSGLLANVRADRVEPITLLARGSDANDVRVLFADEHPLTLTLAINTTDDLPRLSLSAIEADVHFGDVLHEAGSRVTSVIASLGERVSTSEISGALALQLSMPPQVQLLGSDCVLEGLNVTLDMNARTINLSGSVNFDAYTDNPIYHAFNSALLEATLSPTGFEGTITADGGVEPITLLDRGGEGRDVRLSIEGTPSITLSIEGATPSFDFGSLHAEVNFGEVLQRAKTDHTGTLFPVIARLDGSVLHFGDAHSVYLLGSDFGINTLEANFNLNTTSITLQGDADLSAYTGFPLIHTFNTASFLATLSPSGFDGTLSGGDELDPVTILARGGVGRDVAMHITDSPQLQVSLRSRYVDFGISGGSMELHFGDLLEGSIARLVALRNESGEGSANVYSWRINGSKRLLASSHALLDEITGRLDVSDITNPHITVNADLDLEGCGGVLSAVEEAHIDNAIISREGFSADVQARMGSVDIWQERSVELRFIDDPLLSLALSRDELHIGFSHIKAEIDFGSLLDNAVARVNTRSGEMQWWLDGSHELAHSGIHLDGLSGSLDLLNPTEPSITFNAIADLGQYGGIFKFINRAGVENAHISKRGFHATLTTPMQRIDIWKDKNVKLEFDPDHPPRFQLNVTREKVAVALTDISASLHFGDLMKDTVATLEKVEDTLYRWRVSGLKTIQGTAISMQELYGHMNFSDIRTPRITLNAKADLSSYGALFSELVSLNNATISNHGFQGDFSTQLSDIDIWRDKHVKVDFTEGVPQTLHLNMTRNDLSVSLSDIEAALDFGDLLDGERIVLTHYAGGLRDFGSRVSITRDSQGIYAWSLSNSHRLVRDENGEVHVRETGGIVNLQNMLDPIIIFDTTADFSNYHFELGSPGEVRLDNAVISSSGIDWGELSFSGASTEFTILELGSGENDDVRIELYNVDGTTGGIDSADGMLYFGKLFEENLQPISLHYDRATGTYSFESGQSFTYRQDAQNSIVLSSVSGSVVREREGRYTITLHSTPQLRATLLAHLGIEALSVANLTISNRGFSGDISASWSDEGIDILNAQAKLLLEQATVRIDSTHTPQIALTAFSGEIDLSPVFDGEHIVAALNYADSAITWGLSGAKSIHEYFIFNNLAGTLTLDELNAVALEISGKFKYKDLDTLELELEGFRIGRSGLRGTVGLASGASVSIPELDGLAIKQLSVTFADSISGSLGIDYDKTHFLGSSEPLHVSLSAQVDRRGIRNFSVDADGLNSVSIPNFATLSFTHVTTAPSWRNFWINLDGSIEISNTMFSGGDVEFEGLKISRSGITVESAEVEFDVSGASASLGGLSVSVEEAGIGFHDSRFYLSARGGLSLEGIHADAGVQLYADGNLRVEDISIEVSQPGLTLSGKVAWYNQDETYGNGFSGTGLGLHIAESIHATGAFYIGKIGKKDGYLYWMGQAQGRLGPSGISFGPINIYELGGGVAHNMSYDSTNEQFEPQNGTEVFMLSTLLGTQDMGYTWHGLLDLNLDTSGQITLRGKTYILSQLGHGSEDRSINGSITITTSPESFHAGADVTMKYQGLGLDGKADILFAPGEKHVYVGTNSEFAESFNVTEDLGPVRVSIFGFNTEGYFMIDTHRLAFGMAYMFDKTWSRSWRVGPDPSLHINVGARADALVVYNPFQMYANADVTFGATACYGPCVSMGVDLALEVAMPDPAYVYGSARVHFLGINPKFTGYIYGEGRDGSVSSETQPQWLDYIEPYAERDVGLLPEIKVYTILSDVPDGVEITINAELLDMRTDHTIRLEAYDLDEGDVGKVFVPQSVLSPNSPYELRGYIHVQDGSDSDTEVFSRRFTTQESYHLDFDEIIETVTPPNGTNNVREDEHITLRYNRHTLASLGADHALIQNFSIEIRDAQDEPITGTFIYDATQATSTFIPSQALRIYHYCQNSSGQVRETFLNSDGAYLNPFNGFTVDGAPASSESYTPVISTERPGLGVRSSINHRGLDLGVVNRVVSDGAQEYTYFTNNTYTIVIKDSSNDNAMVYHSTFNVGYNLHEGESQRRIEAMGDQLEPRIIVSRNTHNRTQVRTDFEHDLESIGARSSDIVMRITSQWQILSSGDSIGELVETVQRQGTGTLDFENDVMSLLRATIEYFDRDSGRVWVTKAMRIESGDAYSTASQEEAEETLRESEDRITNDVRGVNARTSAIIPVFNSDDVSGGRAVGGGTGVRDSFNLGGGF